jgi:hypothetical protein
MIPGFLGFLGFFLEWGSKDGNLKLRWDGGPLGEKPEEAEKAGRKGGPTIRPTVESTQIAENGLAGVRNRAFRTGSAWREFVEFAAQLPGKLPAVHHRHRTASRRSRRRPGRTTFESIGAGPPLCGRGRADFRTEQSEELTHV